MAIVYAVLFIFTGLCGAEGLAGAEAPEDETVRYLKSLSLEELAGLRVTSVSKSPMKISDAPAAVFVITGEDIRRSGVTSIPEALRMAPGVQVARVTANSWAITARGFNRFFSNKLLVMIDGRAIYSPLYSGVFWTVQDTLLEDVDRIEVIRGPGASLWGANAVNGVINIITKSSKDTRGGLITAGAGTEERGFGGVRYGARVGESAHVRAYAKYFDRDAGADWRGVDAKDEMRKFLTGFRADWRPSADNALTFQGDVYNGESEVAHRYSLETPPYTGIAWVKGNLEGGNLIARWSRAFSGSGDFAVRMYYDHTKLESSLIDEVRDTLDMDVQHGFTLGQRHEVMWGAEYRWTRDRQGDIRIIEYFPPERTLDLFSVFIQDQMTLVENRLWLIVGAKFENGYYTDWEAQPTGRVLWRPLDAHTFWAAISRAVRTPSRMERDGRVPARFIPTGEPGNPTSWPIVMRVNENNAFSSETLTAYEAGWRFQPSERLFCDLAFFFNDYRDLASLEFTEPPTRDPGPPPLLKASMTFENGAEARTRGMELAVKYLPLDWWRLQFTYTWFSAKQWGNGPDAEGLSPEHQIGLRSSMDLPYNIQLDVWPRHVGELSSIDIDGYITLDIRLGWRPAENLEISLAAQNLLGEERPEFHDLFAPIVSTAVERGVYVKVAWRF
ncbi:MAG: TonB-dependent receptor [Desulfobacterales bacterium]|nr:TonB-dependent receptor [Desulfobacterales bacterium]